MLCKEIPVVYSKDYTVDRLDLRSKYNFTVNIKCTQFNPLNTKRRLLYLKTQSVPCCKHF